MKNMIVSLFLIILTGTARVEAHAFLKEAEPSVGCTVPSMRLGRKWTSAMCTWIARIARCCTFLCRVSEQESIKWSGVWFLSIRT